MARYLVTGGAGFIGNHLVRRLVNDGHFVRAVDNLSTGKRANLEGVIDRIEFIEGDITNPETCRSAVKGIDHVLHEAALPSVPRSIEDPVGADFHNVHGTVLLLTAAKDAGVKRFVQACSSSAYGNTDVLPKVETMLPSPLSPYAASKLAGELYGRVFHQSYGLEYVGLRYFNVFGPRQDPMSQYAAVIPKFITAYIEGKAPVVFGDGSQSRDFCYIDNVVEANLLACQSPTAPGQIFNIACGDQATLLETLDEVARHFGRTIPPQFEPERAGDVKHSLADIRLAQEHLGYRVRISFKEGLERTIQWYRDKAAR